MLESETSEEAEASVSMADPWPSRTAPHPFMDAAGIVWTTGRAIGWRQDIAHTSLIHREAGKCHKQPRWDSACVSWTSPFLTHTYTVHTHSTAGSWSKKVGGEKDRTPCHITYSNQLDRTPKVVEPARMDIAQWRSSYLAYKSLKPQPVQLAVLRWEKVIAREN